MVHYTYFHSIFAHEESEKLFIGCAVAAAILFLGRKAASSLTTKEGLERNIVPQEVSLTSIFDFFFSAFLSFHDSLLGKSNRKYAGITSCTFLFIFLCNILGLIPGVAAATTTVWINVAIAFVIFGYFNYQGVKAQGFVNYIKHFCGPVWWLAIFIFPLEIFSTCLRIFTLNLRLYWNISADHLVLGIFSDLVPYIAPMIFYGFGTIVAFMQAFVFTTLSIIYILLATQHADGHEEHAH